MKFLKKPSKLAHQIMMICHVIIIVRSQTSKVSFLIRTSRCSSSRLNVIKCRKNWYALLRPGIIDDWDTRWFSGTSSWSRSIGMSMSPSGRSWRWSSIHKMRPGRWARRRDLLWIQAGRSVTITTTDASNDMAESLLGTAATSEKSKNKIIIKIKINIQYLKDYLPFAQGFAQSHREARRDLFPLQYRLLDDLLPFQLK